jgi:hypothetical protein
VARCPAPHVEREADLEPRLRPSRLPTGYVETIKSMGTAHRLSEVAFENLKIAWILRRKFRWLKRAVASLLLAIALAVPTLVSWALVAAKHVKTE